MIDDAKSAETPTETIAEAPASQPAQGNETPATTTTPETGSAPQGRSDSQPPTIPKYRFDDVNHRMQAAERELAQLRQAQNQQPPAPAPQPPKQDDFQTYEEYIRADAKFVAEQAAEAKWNGFQQQQQQAAQRQAEQTRAQTADQNWNQKTSEAAAKYPDFEQKLFTAPNIFSDHTRAVLKASPMAGDLAYHLASNPEIIGRLNGMHPLDAAAELGRIEGKLAGSTTPPKTSVSKAPKPISPVGSGKTPASRDFSPDMSQEEFDATFKPLW